MEAAFAFIVSREVAELGLKSENYLMLYASRFHSLHPVRKLYLLIPIGERHHHIQGGGNEDNVEY